MRNNLWLQSLLKTIWQEHFHDVRPSAPIEIRFGKRARTRLGSISYDRTRKVAVIRLTRLFAEPEVPALVVKATIVHELCHYAHGFNSGLVPQHRYPHAGGIVKQEFAERGLEDLYTAQRRWLKANWRQFVARQFPESANYQIKRRARISWF